MKKMLSNIVFTKNRPLQLHAYLQSFRMHFSAENIKQYILYKPELFDAEYQQVFAEFGDCTVIRETNFHDDFERLMAALDTEYVHFGTDDVVYFDSVDLNVVQKTFEVFGESIFGFSLRLCPEMLIDLKESKALPIGGQTVWQINWKTSKDRTARYPFELNGTIYKTDLVRKILKPVSQEHPLMKKFFFESWLGKIISLFSSMKDFKAYVYTYRTPNSLEGFSARWCKTHKKAFPQFLFFQKLCASAIQVNIVNTEINNPTDGGNEYTVESLNEKFKQGYNFDIDFLIKNKPRKTHAGKDVFRVKKIEIKNHFHGKD